MIKLVTVNIEGARHYDRITELITTTQPDVLCLQELPSAFLGPLAELGYLTTYAPMLVGNEIAPRDCIGIGIATKQPTSATVTYYAGNKGVAVPYERDNCYHTISNPVIVCEYQGEDGQTYHIATAHQPVTIDGTADAPQNEATKNLLAFLATQPTHILCGDMNMPRGYNTNYTQFCAHYTDEIPNTYTSSLDRTLHRLGSRSDLNAPIFDIYMVDYIFSQPPYHVTDVSLMFGFSDHAAVHAQISKTKL